MFAGGGIGPFARRALRGCVEPDKERAAGCISDIADQPVAPSRRHWRDSDGRRLGPIGEPARQIVSNPGHGELFKNKGPPTERRAEVQDRVEGYSAATAGGMSVASQYPHGCRLRPWPLCRPAPPCLRQRRVRLRAAVPAASRYQPAVFGLAGHVALLQVRDAIRRTRPFASLTACRMRALVTRPRKLSTVGFHPAAAISRSTARAS